jgi:hypothetical protein
MRFAACFVLALLLGPSHGAALATEPEVTVTPDRGATGTRVLVTAEPCSEPSYAAFYDGDPESQGRPVPATVEDGQLRARTEIRTEDAPGNGKFVIECGDERASVPFTVERAGNSSDGPTEDELAEAEDGVSRVPVQVAPAAGGPGTEVQITADACEGPVRVLWADSETDREGTVTGRAVPHEREGQRVTAMFTVTAQDAPGAGVFWVECGSLDLGRERFRVTTSSATPSPSTASRESQDGSKGWPLIVGVAGGLVAALAIVSALVARGRRSAG